MSSKKSNQIDYRVFKNEFDAIRLQFMNDIIEDNSDDRDNTDKEKNIQDRLYKMIDYAIKRHDWYEDQKQKLLQIAVALLSVFAALSGIVAKLAYDQSIVGVTFWLICLFLLSGILSGLFIVYKYNSTISLDHPYRKVTDIKSWFFKYNFGEDFTSKISSRENIAKKQVDQIVKSFKNFSENWLKFANEKKRFLIEDLEQVFILQILQKYRSEQLKSMSKALTSGIFASSAFLFLSVIFYIYSPRQINQSQQDKLHNAIDSTRRSVLDSLAKVKSPSPDTQKQNNPNIQLKEIKNINETNVSKALSNKTVKPFSRIDTSKKK